MLIVYIALTMLTGKQLQELRRVRLSEDSPNRVYAAMKLVGVTQKEIENATGIAQPYVSNIVNGKHSKLPLETARRLARFFGCSIEDLFPPQVAA